LAKQKEEETKAVAKGKTDCKDESRTGRRMRIRQRGEKIVLDGGKQTSTSGSSTEKETGRYVAIDAHGLIQTCSIPGPAVRHPDEEDDDEMDDAEFDRFADEDDAETYSAVRRG
jgi:hypothetical protein